MQDKRFSKNDSGFICGHCGRAVEPLGYSSRNHCPFCLWSLHADVNPGDRASTCGGLMKPVAALPDRRTDQLIVEELPFQSAGGFQKVLVELSDALPYRAFEHKQLD